MWFDGMWAKREADWQEDRLYSTIRKYQPEAMIINNTGLSEQGKVGHPQLDSVTFERGKPCFVDNSDRHRAGEMCQVTCDHWGYAAQDINFKSVAQILGDLIDCRSYNCNYLLNIGPLPSGKPRLQDVCSLEAIGKWIKINKNFIYDVRRADIEAENAVMLKSSDGKYYAVVSNVPMAACADVQGESDCIRVRLGTNAKIKSARLLDNGKRIKVSGNEIFVPPFTYGTSLIARVAEIVLE